MTFNPDRWMSSMMDEFENQVKLRVIAYMGGAEDAIEILLDHFASDGRPDVPELLSTMDKTIIHFTIDANDNKPLGFGRQVVDGDELVTVDDGTFLTEYMGRIHTVNFDVGVVATDQAGGASARYRAYEMLDYIFNGVDNKRLFETNTGGIEIISFDAGRFAKDTINDVRAFRIVGAELVVRVYSRDVASDPVILVDQEPIQDVDVEIGGSHIVDD